MKAFYITSYKRPEGIVYGELADPVPATDQLLVQIKAVSVNPVDYKILRGDLKMIVGSGFPRIVGSDYAGIIKDVGGEIKNFKPGDRIYGAVPIFFRNDDNIKQRNDSFTILPKTRDNFAVSAYFSEETLRQKYF